MIAPQPNVTINVSTIDESRMDKSEPAEDSGIQLRPLETKSSSSSGTTVGDSGVSDSMDIKDLTLDTSTVSMGVLDVNSSANTYNRFLLLPPQEPFLTFTPRPLRRTCSARAVGEIPIPGTPRLRRLSPNHPLSPVTPSSYCADSISAVNVPSSPEITKEEKTQAVKRNLSKLLSSIYAVFLITLGVVLYVSDQHQDQKILTEVYSSIIAFLGIVWLIFLHVDLCIYKRVVLKQLKEREDAMQEASDRISTATEFIINSGFTFNQESNSSDEKNNKPPPYRFMQGRHSGSFYLKIGMAAFCFGNLIYEGLQLGQHILNFVDHEKKQMNCSRPSSVMLHIILPLHAFYQLFITFKYSNIVINRFKSIARFGLMHLIATCLCFWFSTIVQEAVEDYNHKSGNSTVNVSTTEFDIASYHVVVHKKSAWINPYHCSVDSVLSLRSMKAIPYLYPFAIEYNLLLAGVWYVVWQNIGKEHYRANPHHIRHMISQDDVGSEEITYQSNLVISADCHASNKGLFVGLFFLLTTIVTVIVFFVAMTTDGYQDRAVAIHTAQEGLLTMVGLLCIIMSFTQITKLDLNLHPITFLDDLLLFIPLPFYFLHGIMSLMAEYHFSSHMRLAVHVLVTLQVIVQTPVIIDGLRRCSNTQTLRYKKPGREIITFLIILNLTLWVVNTFELKSVEHHHAQEEYFGDLVWLFIGHTTIPLMLFYRFHSSVCLADMWKSAYEKGE